MVEVIGGLDAGHRNPLPSGSWSIGRRGADLTINDPTISAVHASIDVARNGSVTLTDRSSLNGTWVGRCADRRPDGHRTGSDRAARSVSAPGWAADDPAIGGAWSSPARVSRRTEHFPSIVPASTDLRPSRAGRCSRGAGRCPSCLCRRNHQRDRAGGARPGHGPGVPQLDLRVVRVARPGDARRPGHRVQTPSPQDDGVVTGSRYAQQVHTFRPGWRSLAAAERERRRSRYQPKGVRAHSDPSSHPIGIMVVTGTPHSQQSNNFLFRALG